MLHIHGTRTVHAESVRSMSEWAAVRRWRQTAHTSWSVSIVPAAVSEGAPHPPQENILALLSLDEPHHSRVALRINSPARTSRRRCAAPSKKNTMSTTILHSRSSHHAFACWSGTIGPAASRRRPAAPRPRRPAKQRQHRHGWNPQTAGSTWSFGPPTTAVSKTPQAF